MSLRNIRPASILRLSVAPHSLVSTRALPLRRLSSSTRSSLLLPRPVPVASPRAARLFSTQHTSNHDDSETVDSNEWSQADLEAEIRSDVGATPELAPASTTVGSDAIQRGPQGNAVEEDSQDQPWYLQEEPPRHPTLVPELQPLPEIPANTPAILADLVKCVAEDMGLDDLNLVDLRELDPPAALGPSLIMLFGSARSERHLHISAGRLKSWLRKRGFNAHADGLIGRKDFKIQQRRRQRRAKLLGTTPSPSESGLTTRWVCMNLGTIGYEATDEMPFSSDNGALTGFGIRQTGGTTIVLQMFTESKRKELGLEQLWARILARRQERNNFLVEDDLEYAEADVHPNEVSVFTEGGSPKVLAQPSQRRFFSTSSRRLAPPSNQPPPDPLRDLTAKVSELEELRKAFAELSHTAAVETLSPAEADRQSAWTNQWNGALRYLAPEQSWRFRLWLVVASRKLGLHTHGLGHLRKLVEEMELLGIICDRSQYIELLQAVYLEHADSEAPVVDQSQLALDILNVMFERGQPIASADVVISLLESLARTATPSKQKGELQKVLEKFINQADLPYPGEDGVVRLLDAYASQDNWDRWWAVWRMAPQHGLARSERLYTHMWTTMAATRDQRRCREALRWYYVEMVNEQPPVRPVGVVKQALESCLRIADPHAEETARRVVVHDFETKNTAEAEFVHMWRVVNPGWAELARQA